MQMSSVVFIEKFNQNAGIFIFFSYHFFYSYSYQIFKVMFQALVQY